MSAEAIAAAVARLAAEIDRDQHGRPLLLVGVLKGAVFFLCDLARRLRTPLEIDFLQVSSYGRGTQSSGNVRFVRDLSIDVAGRDVLIVEDVVDSGATLRHILDLLATRGPGRVRVCALLRKPSAASVPVDYLGFDIPERFVVGYGLDFAERYRNLPYVAALSRRDEDEGEAR